MVVGISGVNTERIAGGWPHIPSWSPIEGLGCVVVALAVAAEIKEFVLNKASAEAIEVEELVRKALPLSLSAVRVVGAIGVVGAVDEAKVRCGLRWGLLSVEDLPK